MLRSDEITSEYTNEIINSLTEKGMIFSYATARSLVTAKKVTKGLTAKIPLIVYNGAFVIDNISEKLLIENYFDNSVESLLEDLFHNEVYPIVYAFINDEEKFSEFMYSDIPELMKILLREEAWFELVTDRYRIDVGYDYYVHIYTERILKKPDNLPEGIFLEKL